MLQEWIFLMKTLIIINKKLYKITKDWLIKISFNRMFNSKQLNRKIWIYQNLIILAWINNKLISQIIKICFKIMLIIIIRSKKKKVLII